MINNLWISIYRFTKYKCFPLYFSTTIDTRLRLDGPGILGGKRSLLHWTLESCHIRLFLCQAFQSIPEPAVQKVALDGHI